MVDGMSEGDVTGVIATEGLLTGYLTEVTEASTAHFGGPSAEHFDEVVDPNWNPLVTRGARLVSIVNDCLEYAGQASYTRGILAPR